MTISAVIFDCDGVVVDSEEAAFRLLGQDLAGYGLPRSPAEMHAMFLGGTVQGIFVEARRLGASLPDDWVQDFYARLYDLLALRAEIENNKELQSLVQWWGEFQVSAPPEQKGMLTNLDEEPEPRRRHRRPRKRAPRQGSA